MQTARRQTSTDALPMNRSRPPLAVHCIAAVAAYPSYQRSPEGFARRRPDYAAAAWMTWLGPTRSVFMAAATRSNSSHRTLGGRMGAPSAPIRIDLILGSIHYE
jgi:hypothetical protein